jgi:hypothetical protein
VNPAGQLPEFGAVAGPGAAPHTGTNPADSSHDTARMPVAIRTTQETEEIPKPGSPGDHRYRAAWDWMKVGSGPLSHTKPTTEPKLPPNCGSFVNPIHMPAGVVPASASAIEACCKSSRDKSAPPISIHPARADSAFDCSAFGMGITHKFSATCNQPEGQLTFTGLVCVGVAVKEPD